MKERAFQCYFCGKEVPFPARGMPCHLLNGWLTVHHWEGPQMVSPYNFCSFDCLKGWIDTQLPQIPSTFLKAFEDEANQN